MASFEKLLEELIKDGKIKIDGNSVVVEFLCGVNRTAARVISKYKPRSYYANDNDISVFDPRLFPSRACFPSEIDEMGIKFLNCDVLDVDYFVTNYNIGLFYDSLHIVDSISRKNSFSSLETETYRSWLKNVKRELEQDQFTTLDERLQIDNRKKFLSKWLEYIKKNREDMIELLQGEITLRDHYSSPFSLFFNPLYVLMQKISYSLNQNGALMIFEKKVLDSDGVNKNLGKLQKHGYVKFREIGSLPPSSSENRLIYVLK
jgi:hypothetical protein